MGGRSQRYTSRRARRRRAYAQASAAVRPDIASATRAGRSPSVAIVIPRAARAGTTSSVYGFDANQRRSSTGAGHLADRALVSLDHALQRELRLDAAPGRLPQGGEARRIV